MNQVKRDRTYMQDIRSEMQEFMAALEENVAGYVALMEKMRKDADNVMDSVNRKLRLLEKESQKLEQSRQTYNDLSRRKSLVTSVVDIQKSGATPKRETEHESSYDQKISIGMKNLSEHLRESTQSMQQGSSKAVVDKHPPKAGKGSAERVASLWREGKEAKEIAEKLNLSLGEVELALELMGSRRS
ncbi:hypothetical protein [Entomospira culicis]|nr:hypothetical protein [Entomospira culicis]WDI37785.1 hypothetical protein PVA46_03090 [Entomospira culicis]